MCAKDIHHTTFLSTYYLINLVDISISNVTSVLLKLSPKTTNYICIVPQHRIPLKNRYSKHIENRVYVEWLPDDCLSILKSTSFFCTLTGCKYPYCISYLTYYVRLGGKKGIVFRIHVNGYKWRIIHLTMCQAGASNANKV